jgi:multidrug resistance efflux pump
VESDRVIGAKAQLDQAQTTKDYSVIVAPMDGQLGEVNPRVGATYCPTRGFTSPS